MVRLHPLKILLSYVTDHWHGRLSLAWSFWINLVGLRVVVFTLQTTLALKKWPDYVYSAQWMVFLVIAVHGVLLIWQIVGVVRSAEVHFSKNGNMALVWGVQLGAVLCFILTGIYALAAMQLSQNRKLEQNPFVLIAEERSSLYSLTVDTTKTQLTIEGSIELGVSKAVRHLFTDNSDINQVNLNSPGGNIYEARALAKLFRENDLTTNNVKLCASACTTAFVGGVYRLAAPGARFGFHQYRVDADYSVIVTDSEKEQRRDAVFFLESGVSEDFVGVMYNKVSDDMWWPEIQELLAVGFLHQ